MLRISIVHMHTQSQPESVAFVVVVAASVRYSRWVEVAEVSAAEAAAVMIVVVVMGARGVVLKLQHPPSAENSWSNVKYK